MKVKLLNPVEHDGVLKQPDSEISVSDEAGAELIACGAAEAVAEVAKPAKKATKEVE